MAISVDEVILHQHLKESSGSKAGDNFIEWVPNFFIVSHGYSLDEGLDQHSVLGVLLEGKREVNIMAFLKHPIESVEILHLESEIDLLSQSSLKRRLAYGDLHRWREERGEITQKKHKVHVSLNIFIHVWVTHFYCHLFPLVFCTVDLAY